MTLSRLSCPPIGAAPGPYEGFRRMAMGQIIYHLLFITLVTVTNFNGLLNARGLFYRICLKIIHKPKCFSSANQNLSKAEINIARNVARHLEYKRIRDTAT